MNNAYICCVNYGRRSAISIVFARVPECDDDVASVTATRHDVMRDTYDTQVTQVEVSHAGK